MKTIVIYKLSFKDASEILSNLDKKFGLIYKNNFCAYGNTITARIFKYENRFKVEISTSYFETSTIMRELQEYDNDYFLTE